MRYFFGIFLALFLGLAPFADDEGRGKGKAGLETNGDRSPHIQLRCCPWPPPKCPPACGDDD